MSCKGLCSRFKNKRGGKYSLYDQNFKRCSQCTIYIKCEGNRCPCCRYPLRHKRRSAAKKILNIKDISNNIYALNHS